LGDIGRVQQRQAALELDLILAVLEILQQPM